MMGAVAGDIIGSPYEWNNTEDFAFNLLESNFNRRNRKDPVHHARMTDESVLTLAVADWLISDPERRMSHLTGHLLRLSDGNIRCGFSPMMERWTASGGTRPMRDSGCAAAAMVSPIGLASEHLSEAVSTARGAAQLLYRDDTAIKGAEAMAEAVWLLSHGQGKEELRYAMEEGYGMDFTIPYEDLKKLVRGYEKEPILVNGEDTGEYFLRETGRPAFDAMTLVNAAVRCFLESSDFEEAVRKAVVLGGKSDTLCSLTGALAGAKFGVPDNISVACRRFLPQDLLHIDELFEKGEFLKAGKEEASPKKRTDTFQIIKTGDGNRLFAVAPGRKDIINALKKRFGEEITLIRPAELKETLRRLNDQGQEGTYLEKPRPDLRTIHFQEGEFRTSATAAGPEMAPQEERLKARSDFYRICDYAQEVKMKLQRSAGYEGEGSIHFGSAYYPEIFHERVEIWKGDILAGAVGIDPSSGLLTVSRGGDFGPMEWDGERTSSVFTTASPDDIRQAIGSCCLDEGLRTSDIFSKSNLETANEDIARSKDTTLLEAVECLQKNQRAMKM